MIIIVFEENSTCIELSIEIDMPVQNWHVYARTLPLTVSIFGTNYNIMTRNGLWSAAREKISSG